MALQIKGMRRQFRFTNNAAQVKLDDPNPELSPEQVMSLYSNQYPALTTATVQGPSIEDDVAVYEFKTTIGTKG